MEPRISCRGLRHEYVVADQRLTKWYFTTMNKNRKLLTRGYVQEKARNIFHNAGITSFKASNGWYRRWNARCQKLKHTFPQYEKNITEPPVLENFSELPIVQAINMVFNSEINLNQSIQMSQSDSILNENQLIDLISFTEHNEGINSRQTQKKVLSVVSSVTKQKIHNNEKIRMKQTKKGERYLPQFKEKVLVYAESHGLKEAAEKFQVNCGSITSWRYEKHSTLSSVEGKTVTCSDSDVKFITSLCEWRESGKELSTETVKCITQENIASYEHQKCWITQWFKRWESGCKSNHHIKYPLEFKLEVVKFAKSNNQMAATRVFGVSRKCVFEWIKLLNTDSKSSNKPVGRSVKDIDIDQEVWDWFRSQQKRPSGAQVRAKATEMYRVKGYSDIKCSYGWYRRWCWRYSVRTRHFGDEVMLRWVLIRLEQGHSITHVDLREQALKLLRNKKHASFKASPGWAIRFCRRYPELLQRVPGIDSTLPKQLTKKVNDFRTQITTLTTREPSFLTLGCMDEVHFSFCASLPVTGKCRELIRKSEVENCQATIILACLAEGVLLPPMVVLKGNNGEYPDIENDIVVTSQQKSIVDEKIMELWLDHVWFKFVKPPNALILDCYEPHKTDLIKQLFRARDCHLCFIPGGCSSKLQPIQLEIRKRFQEIIEEQWKVGNVFSWDGPTRLQLPSRHKIVQWVATAYNTLQSNAYEMIRESFKKTGLVAENINDDEDINNFISQLVS